MGWALRGHSPVLESLVWGAFPPPEDGAEGRRVLVYVVICVIFFPVYACNKKIVMSCNFFR